MTPGLILVLQELDGHPTSHMSLPAREMNFHQVQGWYFEVRRGGRLVRRGLRHEPFTLVEIEDLLTAYKP